MPELTPSNDLVRTRADELEGRLKRVVALAAAISDLASLLPPGSREVDAIQSLAFLLDEEAPLSLGDCMWLIHSFSARHQQINSLLKSVA